MDNTPIKRIVRELTGHYLSYKRLTFWHIITILDRLMKEDNIIGYVMCDNFIAEWLETNRERIDGACRAMNETLADSILRIRDNWRDEECPKAEERDTESTSKTPSEARS